jgi:hypothetical protein
MGVEAVCAPVGAARLRTTKMNKKLRRTQSGMRLLRHGQVRMDLVMRGRINELMSGHYHMIIMREF